MSEIKEVVDNTTNEIVNENVLEMDWKDLLITSLAVTGGISLAKLAYKEARKLWTKLKEGKKTKSEEVQTVTEVVEEVVEDLQEKKTK